MNEPRILNFRIPTVANATHFQISFSAEQLAWKPLLVSGSADIAVARITSERIFVLDGVNALDDEENNASAASTPPNWYRFRQKTASGYGSWSPPFVFPSMEDFLAFIKRRLDCPSLEGGLALRSDPKYLDNLSSAVDAFETGHPLELSETFTLASSQQRYRLPALWDDDFSHIVVVEYPAQDSDPRDYIPVEDVVVDRAARQWTFINGVYPANGESATLTFTGKHARDGSTVPQQHFESVALWATGDAAEALALKFNQMGNGVFGAQVVEPEQRVKEWRTMAADMKRQAAATWGSGRTGVRGRVSLYDDHGRIPPSVWG